MPIGQSSRNVHRLCPLSVFQQQQHRRHHKFQTAGNEANLNLLPANRMDPNALALLKLFPSSTNKNAYYSGNYFQNYKVQETDRQFDIRIDHNFSDRDSISGFYSYAKTDQFTPPFLPGRFRR